MAEVTQFPYFTLNLKTVPPTGALTLGTGSAFTANAVINAIITTTELDIVQYKIWGDVDTDYNTDVQDTEATSTWLSYTDQSVTKEIKLDDSTEGNKTIYVKLKDNVNNESSSISAIISLDLTAPEPVIVSGPTPNKISKINGKRKSQFAFTVNEDITGYKVKVVPDNASLHTAGTEIPTTNGSTNMSSNTTTEANTTISCEIDGADLELASAGDGAKIVKVFVCDAAGIWSV